MLEIIKDLLLKIIIDIDTGNSNITEEEAIEIVNNLKRFTDKDSRLSKYVAINAQYHDYCELFKSWFNDGIEQKIIESAVVFWFKDDDYKDGFKLWNYFKED